MMMASLRACRRRQPDSGEHIDLLARWEARLRATSTSDGMCARCRQLAMNIPQSKCTMSRVLGRREGIQPEVEVNDELYKPAKKYTVHCTLLLEEFRGDNWLSVPMRSSLEVQERRQGTGLSRAHLLSGSFIPQRSRCACQPFVLFSLPYNALPRPSYVIHPRPPAKLRPPCSTVLKPSKASSLEMTLHNPQPTYARFSQPSLKPYLTAFRVSPALLHALALAPLTPCPTRQTMRRRSRATLYHRTHTTAARRPQLLRQISPRPRDHNLHTALLPTNTARKLEARMRRG
jgi:hypothetical protein